MTRTVLNVLPHAGGGAETFIDCLEPLEGYAQVRMRLSRSRSPLAAAPWLAVGVPRAARGSAACDLVQAHGDVTAMLCAPVLARRPSIVLTHGLHLLRRARGARGRAVRRALRAAGAGAGRVVCSSRAEAAEVGPVLAPRDRDRIVVVSNTAPPSAPPDPGARTAVRAELGVEEGELLVLYAGRLEPRKDPLTVVRAATAARAAGAPLVLALAGDGPLAESVAANAGPAVRPLGERGDIPRLLAGADAFVMPSEREGQSFAVLEAMRAGLAMVVSDGAGNPEAIGAAGDVVRFGDPAGFEAALAALAGDPGLLRDRRAAAARRFADELSPERFLGRMAALYAAVVDEGPRRRAG
ncbi:MAG: glycosyltransferase family 4 protein [Solirubrobacteraceae bacterium]